MTFRNTFKAYYLSTKDSEESSPKKDIKDQKCKNNRDSVEFNVNSV